MHLGERRKILKLCYDSQQFPPPYAPIPFVGDAASPPDIAHLPIWDYIAMLSEDARNAVDRGEDWVESATDNSWIKPG